MAPRGLFILFEGGDCTGKTTQSRMLVERLGANAHYIKFPDVNNASTRFIRNYLVSDNTTAVNDNITVQRIFSQQRFALQNEMTDCLIAGTNLVVDRYAFSGLVYSHALCGNFEDVKFNENHLIAPDLVFLLTCDPVIAHTRKPSTDRFETIEFQHIVQQTFIKLHNHYTQHTNLHSTTWTLIDCTNADTATIHAQIWETVTQALHNNSTLMNTEIQYLDFTNTHLL